MIKIAIIIYHKNIKNIYPIEWVEQCKNSILNQTYKEFDTIECNYGSDNYMIFEYGEFHSEEFPTFVHAMNFLLDRAFSAGYDYVCNVNLDDHYALNRIEKQLWYMQQGYDLISSNFSLIRDDQVIHTHHFDKLDIQRELSLQNNIICHPVVAYSKKFWEGNRYVPSEIPFEDKLIWERAINNGYKFVILPDVLCFHRLHPQSVCSNENNR